MSEKKNIATRDGFGHEIVALGKENPDLLVVDIDIGKSCKTGDFRKELPGQYINVGIAEQNGAGLAAGLATCGKVPFVVTYAVFGSLRMCEMIRQEVCYPNLNVKFACSHGGVTPANDGASHQSIEDMGVLRTIPNMTVIMPADYNAARKLVRQAAETYGPMYLRFTRDAVPQIYDEDVEFTIGKAHTIQDGKDVAIIANGDTVRLPSRPPGSWQARASAPAFWICTPSSLWMWRPSPPPSTTLARSSPWRITTFSTVSAPPCARWLPKWARASSSAWVFRISSVSPLPMSVCWPSTA